MYTSVLIYKTVLAHACAWEEMINYNRIDYYDTGTIGHSYKNTNVKSSQYFSMNAPVLIYITVLAHACAWDEMINYNRIDYYDAVTIGNNYKNTNVKSSQYFSMYTPVLIYITVLAHACAWEEMVNYNRIYSYDTVTIGHSYKNINVKMIPILFHVQTCANLYYCISTCLCLERNDQLQ